MNWNKIIFCDNYKECLAYFHHTLEDNYICDLDSLPKKVGNYLVSNGKEIDISEYNNFMFCNWDSKTDRKIKNRSITYWLDLKEIELPKE